MYKKVMIAVVIVLLALGNIYFYNKAQKLDYVITVGKPVSEEPQSMTVNYAVDYYEDLKDRDEVNLLMFSLMNYEVVDKPKVCDNLPDLAIMISDTRDNMSYYQTNLWIDGDSVVMVTNGDEPIYKLIDGNRAIELKKIIERYPVKTYGKK